MRKNLLPLVFMVTITAAAGYNQQALSNAEVNAIFPEAVKEQQGIQHNITAVYPYNDKHGKHFIVMTAKPIKCSSDINLSKCASAIYAYSFIEKGQSLNKEWSMRDFIKGTAASDKEYSIDFWKNDLSLTDLDGDGVADPIIVYASQGLNNVSDGRIKILTYYNNKKSAVRHQNSVSDYSRGTTIDKSVYQLPQPVQKQIKAIMKKMVNSEKAIFAWGWEEAMKQGKTKLEDQ